MIKWVDERTTRVPGGIDVRERFDVRGLVVPAEPVPARLNFGLVLARVILGQ